MKRRRKVGTAIAQPDPPVPAPTGDPWLSKEISDALSVNDPELAERLDDYSNTLSGLGDPNQDRMFGGSLYGVDFSLRYLANVESENRWRGSALGARGIEAIPAEMVREGWDIIVQPDEDDDGQLERDETKPEVISVPNQAMDEAPGEVPPEADQPEEPDLGIKDPGDAGDKANEISEDMEAKFEELGASEAFELALQYKRAFGGGAILIGADDGMDPIKPMDETNIEAVNWLNVFSGGREGEIIAWTYYRDPKSPKYGKPEIYAIRNIGVPINSITTFSAAGRKEEVIEPVFWVHESRLIIFSNVTVSPRARVQMRGWGDSVFVRVDEILSQYSQTWAGVSNLMSGFVQDVLSIEGNATKMAGGDKVSKGRPLTKRAREIQRTKSIARMLVIDKATEEFKRHGISVAGVSDVLQQYALLIAAAYDMPVEVLFGQAPAGLSATGDSTVRFFYDRVASWQRRDLRPAVQRLSKLIFLSKNGPTGGAEPERWNVRMRPLYQASQKEVADTRKTIADMDAVYLDRGVYSPEEVAASGFGGSEWTMERTIDLKARAQQKMMAAAAGTTPASGTKITATAAASVMTVNEARAASGLGPLMTPTGEPNPEGNMFLEEYMAKHAAAITKAVTAEGGGQPPAPSPNASPIPPKPGAPGKPAKKGAPPFGNKPKG